MTPFQILFVDDDREILAEGLIAVDDLPVAIRTFGQLLAEVAC